MTISCCYNYETMWDMLIAENVWSFLTIKEMGMVMQVNHYISEKMASNNRVGQRIKKFVERGLIGVKVLEERGVIIDHVKKHFHQILWQVHKREPAIVFTKNFIDRNYENHFEKIPW